jgi:hypothetical protein
MLRCAAFFVVAAYPKVHLTPQNLHALLQTFTKPSETRFFAQISETPIVIFYRQAIKLLTPELSVNTCNQEQGGSAARFQNTLRGAPYFFHIKTR